ncbi:efflux RND transporter periplasmic adaptor subunit [Synechococcus sp. R6-10]|jgi:RND family efflux transporter MFP subunit|uniref:efflux RND transporter periplasmic adaptor subunit n=1 Tax=unclassified Synechococcus TaxID=2626047 RepID=UPI0000694C1A|nr:efflux RND transporter periplasmic adaptor subunit [Synechococcus sp. JA-2-3B'a(2-13)]ABD01701.1 efflux transporter, RND family, MFP subunit [Synechococcus sp. JA-2-3B'a(2-13)]
MQLRTALPLLCLSLLVAACRPGGPPRSMGGEGGGEGQPTPVAVGRVEEQQIEETSEFMASLGSQQVASIRPQVSGQVTQVFVQLGSQVAAGAPLFEIDSRQQQAAVAGQTAGIAAAQANLESGRAVLSQLRADRLRLEAAAEFAREQHERNLRLLAEGAISQAQADQSSRDLRQAEAALAAQQEQIRAQEAAILRAEREVQRAQAEAERQQVQLQFFQVTAPFAGIVGDVLVRQGDYVTPQTVLTTLTQTQALELNLNIPLQRAPQLRIGTPVQILDSRGEVIGSSQISFIAPEANAATQSVLAKALLENPAGQLRSAQFVRTRVIWEERPALLVPVTAVARLGAQTFVYTVQTTEPPAEGMPPGAVAVQRPVQLGSIYGNSYEVLEGLEANEPIVLSGLQKIRDGAPIVDEVLFQQRMQPQGGGRPPGSPP